MFVKPEKNPAYADIKEGQPGHEPARIALQVFDPALKDFLPAEGRDVGADNELYWHRRVIGKEVAVLSADDGAKSIAAAETARARAAADAARAAKPADETSKGAK